MTTLYFHIINMFIAKSKMIIMFLMDNTSVLSIKNIITMFIMESTNCFSVKNMMILASHVPIDASLLYNNTIIILSK